MKIKNVLICLLVLLLMCPGGVSAQAAAPGISWDFEDGIANVFNTKSNATLSIVENAAEKHLKIQAANPSNSGSIADLKHCMPQNADLSGAILFEMDFKTSSAYQLQSFAVELNNNDSTNGGEALTLVGLGQNQVLELGNLATDYKYSLNTWHNIKLYLRLGEDKASHKIRADITKENGESTTLYVDVPERASNIWKDPNLTHDYVRTFYFVGAWGSQVTEVDNFKVTKWTGDVSDAFFTYTGTVFDFDETVEIPELGNGNYRGLYVNPNSKPYTVRTGVPIENRSVLEFTHTGSSGGMPAICYSVNAKGFPRLVFDFMVENGGFWFSSRHPGQDILLSANADKAGLVYAHGNSQTTGDPVAFSNGQWHRAAFEFDYDNKTIWVKLVNLESNSEVLSGTFPLSETDAYFTQLQFDTWYNSTLYIDNMIYSIETDMSAAFSADSPVESQSRTSALLTFTHSVDPSNSENFLCVNGEEISELNADNPYGIYIPLSDNEISFSVQYRLFDMYGQEVSGTASVVKKEYSVSNFASGKVADSSAVITSAEVSSYSDNLTTAVLLTVVYKSDTREIISAALDMCDSLGETPIYFETTVQMPDGDGYEAVSYLWNNMVSCRSLANPIIYK